jgi:hypothetical protein
VPVYGIRRTSTNTLCTIPEPGINDGISNIRDFYIMASLDTVLLSAYGGRGAMRVNSFQRWCVESMFRRDMFHLDTGEGLDSSDSGMPCLGEGWRSAKVFDIVLACARIPPQDTRVGNPTVHDHGPFALLIDYKCQRRRSV